MFSDDLKNAMEKQNVSKKELADYLSVREATVQKWLNGDIPGVGNIYRIGELFDLDIKEYAAEADRRKESKRYRIRTSFDGRKLRYEMNKRNVDTKKIAKICGVTPCAVTNWCANRNKPSTSSMLLLNDFFNVTSEYWAEEKESVFTPKEPVREEAKEIFKKTVNHHESDKEKVRENLEKLNGEPKEETMNFTESEVKILENSDTHRRLIREINAKNTEIQGLKCEIEGLKVENARLQGNIEGLTQQLLLKSDDTKEAVKESFWKRVFA